MSIFQASEWDSFLSHFPDAHLLQTAAWGDLKAEFGWQPIRLVAEHWGAQLLFRRLPLGFSLAYIPKGPVGGRGDQDFPPPAFWAQVDRLCREQNAVFLKVEPDEAEPAAGSPAGELKAAVPPGFRRSFHSVQPQRTLIVSLKGDEQQILGRMKQKTRYNIRLALKKGVVVRPSADLETFHRLMQATGQRDTFAVHSYAYYRQAYDLFHPRGECELLIAEYQGEPLGALMAFARGSRAWYFYGASANEHRERMPTYILQWEAMRWARSRGCAEYDLWGVPDADEITLEETFTQRSAGLWGVYRFKRGFGGELVRAVGPWDRVYKPALYACYQWWINRRSSVEDYG